MTTDGARPDVVNMLAAGLGMVVGMARHFRPNDLELALAIARVTHEETSLELAPDDALTWIHDVMTTSPPLPTSPA